MKIQWYPGHMTKAKRAMLDDIKIVDLIIEMVDARAPMSTRNPDIDKMVNNKARIIVLNKSDMSNDNINEKWIKYFEEKGFHALLMDSRQRNSINKLNKLIDIACQDKKQRDAKRGIKNRPIRAMVTGIPNVGKSTLINSLSGKGMAKTGNKPGVTKGNQWLKLNKNVELLDTPGILWPKFEDESIGEKIAYIGSINDMIIDIRELAVSLLKWFLNNNAQVLHERFNIKDMNEYDSLIQIARVRLCLSKGGDYDYDKAAALFINDFRSGKLGKISLESPIKV